MTYVAVIPSVYPPYTNQCVESCKLDNLLVVDNTYENHGVAASWNMGVRRMYEIGADWTIIISATVRFGEPGGLDLAAALDANPDAICVEADQPTRPCAGMGGFGWHMLAFNRRVFDDIGLFDENIWPAYGEDTDFAYRLAKFYPFSLGVPPHWVKAEVDAWAESVGHGVGVGGVKSIDYGQKDYYVRKWGGSFCGYGDGEHEWEHPFNDPANPLSYWPQPPWRDLHSCWQKREKQRHKRGRW